MEPVSRDPEPAAGSRSAGAGAPVPGRTWTLLTNHGRVLLLIAADPQARLRDLADRAGITERAAGSIVGDLEEAGYVTRVRHGRRNSYQVHPDRPFRHPAEARHQVGELLELFAD
jgi:predicted ArsR family transcriptional regulator